MKKPTKSNIYLDVKLQQLAPYAHAIDGDADADACIVGFGPLPDAVRNALFAACAGLDMPEPCVIDASALAAPEDGFAAIEGVDPAALILADSLATGFVASAYHRELPANAAGVLLGRPYAAFEDFGADLADDKLKQRNWALLKTLKRA